jgi:type II secretory pathway pseudopilin PulG
MVMIMTKWIYNNNRHLCSQRIRTAFSLAELMISLGVLGIGLLIIAAAFPVAIDQTRQAVELSTSQLVFKEAVNNLKTKINWVQVERFLKSSTKSLGTSIYLLDYDTISTSTFFTDFDADPNFPIVSNLRYSSDDTYGWLAAVQKISTQCYKFWIFVLREPTGILDNANFKFHFISPLALTTNCEFIPASGQPTNNIRLKSNVVSFPGRSVTFLANNGSLFQVTDSVVNGNEMNISCNNQVSDGAATFINSFTYVIPTSSAKVTRKNPVVAIYQVVITY